MRSEPLRRVALWRVLRGSASGGPVLMAAMAVGLAWSQPVAAEPIAATGTASASEWRQPPAAHVVRARALRRARSAAIQAALSRVEGATPAARKAVMAAHADWTGAYRIVHDRREGGTIAIAIEVDVDLPRLTKRVAGRTGATAHAKPRFVLGAVAAVDPVACGDAHALQTRAATELAAVGAVSSVGGETGVVPVDLEIRCEALGAVRFTHMHAARVEIVAATKDDAVLRVAHAAFGPDDDSAVRSGLSAALFDVGAALAAHQRGQITVEIVADGPGDRIRRLERAVKDTVMGVSAVRVSGVGPGIVRLRVDSALTAKALGERLAGLQLPDFSVTVTRTQEPDVVTIRLD